MRNILIGAAALLAVAMPGAAGAQTTANLGFSYANYDADGSDEVDMWGLDGAFSHDFANGWTVQGEGANDRVDFSGGEIGQGYGAVSAGMRRADHAFYGFVGLTDTIASSGTMIGVGGQFHMAQVSFNGSVGYADFEEAILPEANLTNVHVDGTFFLTDNFGITGEVGWSEAELGPSDVDWTTLGIGASYRFDATPWTVYAKYQNRDADPGEADTFRIGVSFAFGTGTSREEATSGPSWNGAETLYDEVRIIAVAL